MLQASIQDVAESLRRANLWLFMGWQDVRQKYRRSTLGPFWITLATIVFVGMMSVVYSGLFRLDIRTFIPFVAVGIVIWTMISGCLIEGANVFISAGAIIRQVPMPLPVHVFRLVWQQAIYLLHNATVVVLVVPLAGIPIRAATLLVIPALVLLIVNLCWIVLLLGALGARYRDVPTIVSTFTAAIFLVTPVIWQMDMLPAERQWVVLINPFSYLIELVRQPVLGKAPSLISWSACAAMAVAGWAFALIIYNRARTRLAYWI
jgi:ABC-type polysaccharide/polyol phosphate export permease